jgi:hypothetical protein
MQTAHTHLGVEEGGAALVGELLTRVLQAADDARGAGLHSLAQERAVLVARVRQRLVEADVLARALHQHVHLLAALRLGQLIAVVLRAATG